MPTTQAVVIPKAHHVELREVELLPPGPDDVVVQVAYTSISAGTERMLLAGRMPHPMLQFPVVPGYESVGRVVGLGTNAPRELEGRWVYVGGSRCFVDINPAWGGQARTLIADARRVVPLDGLDDPRQGVLLALAATALHGVDLLGTQTTRRVLVLGQGPVGQLAARIARVRGHWVIVSDRVPSRLQRAVADLTINAAELPVADRVQEPVDAIIEATGSMEALAGALPLLANGGTIVLLGYYDELRLPYMPLFIKQARLLTAREWGPGDLLECRDLFAEHALDLNGLITHTLPIRQVQHAYDLGLNDPQCLKLILEWDEP